MRAGQNVTLPSGLVVKWPKDALWEHEACPARDEHSPMPRDFDPGSGLSRTHVQAVHKTCGLWALWLPRTRPADREA